MSGLAAALRFEAARRSHPGCVRELNEDRVLERPDLGLWVVADGMGGHQAGDVASQMVVDALGALGPRTSGYGRLTAVSNALQEVNASLVRTAAHLPRGGVIGATVAALLVFEDHYACVWAGDSRVYRLREGRLDRLTRDHSVVQELVDSGEISPEQARGHRRSNVVTRAVGAGPTLELEVDEGAIRAGDLFLVCSDGLTGAIADESLAAEIAGGPLEPMAERLLQAALLEGASDNVSFVLVRAEAD